VAPLLEKAKRSKLLIFSEYREFLFYPLRKKQQISTYSGGAIGGANLGDIYLHLLTLIGAGCQPVA